MLTSTPAIVGPGNKNRNANSIVLKSNFFISSPPLLPENFLGLADLSLNFAGDLLGLPLQFVKRAFRPVPRAGVHGSPPFEFLPVSARLLVVCTR